MPSNQEVTMDGESSGTERRTWRYWPMRTLILNRRYRHPGACVGQRVLAALAALVMVLLLGAPLRAQPATPVDHAAFDALLRRHVSNGFVDYDAFARAPEFAAYLALLDRVRPDALSEDDRLAYWINVYNAYTIQLVVSHHETESIRNINRTLGVLRLKGPWSEPLVRAGGRRLTLDDVHHVMLRKAFSEPRLHFALACGAIGCAPLRSEAYTGAKLVEQLDDQARTFLRNSPTKNVIDKRPVRLSAVLLAYRSDFGPAREDLGRALAPYFEGDTKVMLAKGRFGTQEMPFDWTLNSLAHVPKPLPARGATDTAR